MPQGVTIVETGRLMRERERCILLRDDGGCWGLFFERNPRDLIGERVTVRGTRFGFGMLHVTAIGRGSEPPGEDRRGKLGDSVTLALGVMLAVSLVLSMGQAVWSIMTSVWNWIALG